MAVCNSELTKSWRVTVCSCELGAGQRWLQDPSAGDPLGK